jgi:putative membrane protein
MKKFTHPDFQTQLSNIISELEQASQIETVVLIKQRSGNYDDVPMALASNLSLLTFSVLFFIDKGVEDYLIYFATLAAFGLGLLIGLALPNVQGLFVKKNRKQRNVEIMARALFQKGGLHHTSAKTGTLIYFSLLEKMVYIVADRGAQLAIPEEEWQKIITNLQSIFNTKNTANSLLKELEKCKETFNNYIPALENNINELPNNLSIDL